MTAMPTHERKTTPRPRRKRSRVNWHAISRAVGIGAAVAITAILALGLLAASGASSYDNLWHLAASHHVPIPRLNPLELDGGLVVMTLIDIVLTAAGYPFAGLRFIARILGAGTIAANVAAGWPDPVGGFLRAFAPAIIVAVTEAVRAFLLKRQRGDDEEGIPFARWMLAPWPTFVLWRRMKLWRITSYARALEMELSRRRAIVRLEMRFGSGWRETAPADLVWMLDGGVHMSEALATVAELTAPKPEEAADTKTDTAGRNRGGTVARRKGGTAGRTSGRQSARAKTGTAAPEPVVPDDVDTQAEALKILAEEPDISGSELGRRVGKTPGYGRTLKRSLAASVPGPDGKG
jgi:hypothetical protein